VASSITSASPGLLDAAHQQLRGPLVVIWDNLNTHVSAAMSELIAARDWLTVFQYLMCDDIHTTFAELHGKATLLSFQRNGRQAVAVTADRCSSRCPQPCGCRVGTARRSSQPPDRLDGTWPTSRSVIGPHIFHAPEPPFWRVVKSIVP
jgi:hypothetical protein